MPSIQVGRHRRHPGSARSVSLRHRQGCPLVLFPDPPGLFLVSLFLRDMTGTELIQRTRLLWPAASPILLIPENHTRLLVEALEAGACAYLPKPCPADELVRPS
jgi:DNA-binding response OmpR family regulator